MDKLRIKAIMEQNDAVVHKEEEVQIEFWCARELIEERFAYIERTEARDRLRESEKRLSQNIYERGVDGI